MTKEEFEAKVFKDSKGCWLYPGKSPYGPTRKAYKTFKGPIENGLWVLHTCDVPKCINPEHLWLGDRRDNMVDAIKKRRQNHAKKTHCLRGHDFAVFGKVRFNRRYCMECDRTRWHDRTKRYEPNPTRGEK